MWKYTRVKKYDYQRVQRLKIDFQDIGNGEKLGYSQYFKWRKDGAYSI